MSKQHSHLGCVFELLGCGGMLALLVFALLGAGYLYQREGGKLFNAVDAMVEPPPLLLEGKAIQVKVDVGLMTHDIIVVNHSENVLTEATVTILMVKKDGTQLETKAHWEKWAPGEEKRINVTASGTRTAGFGIAVTGEASTKTREGRRQRVVIASAWEMKKSWE